jgi:hypothetical protein
MTIIETDEQFVLAINHLIAANLLPVQGERFIDRVARKIYDERGAGIENLIDITPDTPTLEAALGAANATLTVATSEIAQATRAKDNLKTLLSGLHTLSEQDKGYVVLARIMAKNDNQSNAIIAAITTRAQATQYVVNRANWLAVPIAARPMLGDILEAHAVSFSVIIAILT